MSFPTQNVFVHEGSWDSITRKHPAMDWMEKYTNNFDARNFDIPASEWHASTFAIQKSDGQVVSGADKAWAAVKEIYSPFTANLHEPIFLYCSETENGWQMFGIANVFVNLQGQAGPGEQKVKSVEGKEWDAVLPTAFYLEYVREDGGIKLNKTKIFGDPTPAVGLLLQRGVMKPEDLVK
ncbi:hypothetical protein M8818_002076 [Zalaria obscura]|uniref:Uncharacterized protein n=1 Tax=Zalaria obscura TaxID=2024903 RepID=A0ACC3SJH3_9PEZI